jgi:hypothetical protein
MFVPKGYLPLTTAVEQLAEARRAAGQSNDDGKNAARAELRVEAHSGSMSMMVVSPSSGKTYTIRPHHWARETALTWLEQGECLLTEDLVDPPLGRFYRKEHARIFVNLDDLQCLMAISFQHSRMADDEAREKDDDEAREKDKGGRPPEYNWDAVKIYALEMIREHGLPGRGNKKFPSKTQLVEDILNKWASQGVIMAESTVRRHVNCWLKKL